MWEERLPPRVTTVSMGNVGVSGFQIADTIFSRTF